LEQAEPADVQADNLLWSRTPQFGRFNERARQLDSEYDINSADASARTGLLSPAGNMRSAMQSVFGHLSSIDVPSSRAVWRMASAKIAL